MLYFEHYFKFADTNVSNARMNIPKAIRSLKSNGFLSISTTPILCRIEVSHPATRLFLSIYYHKRRQRTIFIISVSPGTPADHRSCREKVALYDYSNLIALPCEAAKESALPCFQAATPSPDSRPAPTRSFPTSTGLCIVIGLQPADLRGADLRHIRGDLFRNTLCFNTILQRYLIISVTQSPLQQGIFY